MNKKFRIGYFADGIWAHEAMKRILKKSEIEISFVCGRFETRDAILKKMAEENEIEFLIVPNVNNEKFLMQVSKYNCDLFVSMSFNQIFKTDIINLCPEKLINCHAGKLPFYRGRNILNWVLINGEKEFGVTVHYVDESIDTGDIILQKSFNISEEDDYGSLLQVAYVECADLLAEAIDKIRSKNVIRVKQDTIHPIGFYCGIRKEGDEVLNWSHNSMEIYNFIRGISRPGPMARSTVSGKEVKINRAKLIKHAPVYIGIPGQVVAKKGDVLTVKTADTTLEILEYECGFPIKIGDRFL